MKALLIEDRDDKRVIIAKQIEAAFENRSVSIHNAPTMQDAVRNLYAIKYDLIVIDLMLPSRQGELPEDMSEELLSAIESSEVNRGSSMIAITGFENLLEEQRQSFAEAGIILVRYTPDDQQWQKHLTLALARIREHVVFDFVIICALEKERNAYRSTPATIGPLKNIKGLDCQHMKIGNYSGVCVKLPRMGLVDASIVSAQAIERFNPKLIAMSGICAGVADEAAIGTLIVADMCWEYQAGKWADDHFKIEHYDISLENSLRTDLSQLISTDPRGDQYKRDLIEESIVFEKISLKPMATGSAVIASKDRMDSIKAQHRKMAALDMEMYGVYRAAELAASKPKAFGAKTVVDLADNAKGDRYHEYGAILSARFVVNAIENLMRST